MSVLLVAGLTYLPGVVGTVQERDEPHADDQDNYHILRDNATRDVRRCVLLPRSSRDNVERRSEDPANPSAETQLTQGMRDKVQLACSGAQDRVQ